MRQGLTTTFDSGDLPFMARVMPLLGRPSAPSDSPSLFSAIREDLGLKLDSQRVTVSTFIVESAEMPSEN